jgi:glycosyltransferase involved in cell wall biosynthesis
MNADDIPAAISNCQIAQVGRNWATAIVIPARNEAEHIESCLSAVLRAVDSCRSASASYIVVVADSCSDATAAIAARTVGYRGEVIQCRAGSVGKARRLGTQAALDHFASFAPSWIWLANTDADTLVAEDWLERQLVLAEAGFQGVAGIVQIGDVRYGGRDVSQALMADYLVHPDGSHPHVHGANLGMRADAYVAAGGWSDAALAEDHCLWHRLKQRQIPLAASANLRVKTSGRLEGRAPGGFAATLKKKLEPGHACLESLTLAGI